MKVLVIEDSEHLRRSLAQGLRRSGFAVDLVADGETGLAYARHGTYDVIVLDLMLPGLDGLTLLERFRRAGGRTHVLILSAKDRIDERIEGLARGADDYLVKPFSFDELVARIRALVRRAYGQKDPRLRVGPLAIDTAKREVSRDGRTISLTPHEYAVLEYLAVRRGSVVSKPDLLDHLYAGVAHASNNAIEVLVHQLRKKLRVPGEPDFIVTRRGHGYLVE